MHDITAYWVPKDSHGCSINAPRACELFQQLQDAGFPVIRAGYPVQRKNEGGGGGRISKSFLNILRYSALAPGAWLRPHFGVTNGQLKFHLGLIVPKQDDKQCAFMRVGNEIRGWEEKQITFFDDSYPIFHLCLLV